MMLNVTVDDVLHRRRGSRTGLRKARCVRKKMARGLSKKSARRACGVKKKLR